jgi:hypothetical protein
MRSPFRAVGAGSRPNGERFAERFREHNKGVNMETIIKFDYEGSALISVETDGNTFTVVCYDYVINEWREDYETLSLALLRVAVLVKCGENNFRDGFATVYEEFSTVGNQFLNTEAI